MQPKPPTSSTQVPQAGKPEPVVKKKLWYCKQCGYVVFREDPPYVCPICKAKKELFAEIDSSIEFRG
jgi:rubrerythrin